MLYFYCPLFFYFILKTLFWTELWCVQFMIEVGSYIWVGGAPEDKGRT